MIEQISINEHSSIRLGTDKVIYFDPFRIPSERHDADIIFVTHAHYDHFSPEDILKVKQSHTLFVMPLSMQGEEEKAEIAPQQVMWMMPDQTIRMDGITVHAVPSYNTNKPMHPKENGWLGYVVELNGQTLYVSGDCDHIPEAEAIQCHIAMLPIGGTYTMNAAEAAELVNRMQPDIVIPTHYGTLVGKPEDADVFEPLVNSGVTVCRKL